MLRPEKDSLGIVFVDDTKLWGAQTQRSLENFNIGKEKMPKEIIRAYAILKKAAAAANLEIGVLSEEKAALISEVCGEISSGLLDDEFPLHVWQTGSGTQTNMNINEVIANRGNRIKGEKLLHPNDDVNRSQSSNDTFPTAMKIAAVMSITDKLLPALDSLTDAFRKLELEYPDIIKVGRTHLQDAVPLRFAQEVSGWRTMLEKSRRYITLNLEALYELPLAAQLSAPGSMPQGLTQKLLGRLRSLRESPLKQRQINSTALPAWMPLSQLTEP